MMDAARTWTRSLALTSFMAAAAASPLFAACSSSSGSPLPDAGADARDAGRPMDAGHDAPSDAGVGLTCAKLLSCDQACSGNACTNHCYAESTGYAQGVFNGLTACIAAACPSTPGGPCASSGSSQCASCNTSAATGPCINTLVACEGDTTKGPPDPDGGGVVPFDAGLTMDGGPHTSCGALVGCQVACKPGDAACAKACFDQGTSTAQALDLALVNCTSAACPTTDGGPCAMTGTACTGCESEADFGACGSQFTACQNDKSATSDAGTEPVALHGGTVHVLASGLDQPQVVVVRGNILYTSEITSTGPVLDLPIDGGAVSKVSGPQPFPMGLSLDGANAYVWNSGSFTSGGALNNGDGTVLQVPLAGGAVTTLGSKMTVAFNAPYLNAVTNDTSNVYWVSGGPGTAGAVHVAPIGGGTPDKVLYGGQSFPEAIATDGASLYWCNWGTFDAKGNYNNDGAVLKAPVGGGGKPVTLASKLSAPAALALDGSNVYFTNIGKLTTSVLPLPGTGSVEEVPIGGGSVVTLASKQDIPLGIAVEGTTVYWAEFTLSAPGSIVSAPVGGGAVTTLVGNVQDPFGITVAGTTVYWSDNVPTGKKTGAILSLTHP